eukprot:3313849-Pleurochrysis_carterae.AAC.1
MAIPGLGHEPACRARALGLAHESKTCCLPSTSLSLSATGQLLCHDGSGALGGSSAATATSCAQVRKGLAALRQQVRQAADTDFSAWHRKQMQQGS